MLKEELLKLKESKNKICSVGDFMEKMDKDTKEVFIDIMRSKISNIKIAEILISEGMSTSDSTIGRVRKKCFSIDRPCMCISGGKNVN